MVCQDKKKRKTGTKTRTEHAHKHHRDVLITETLCFVWFPGEPVKYDDPKSYVEDEGSGRKYFTQTKQIFYRTVLCRES